MKQINTDGIILTRVDYGEADRIITILTPDQGKITAIAKGVRKSKSKLAGGIELFSTSEISYIIGKSEINTLISTRLKKHFGNIVKNIDRTQAGYEVIKLTHRATEDNPESAYYNLLVQSFQALDDATQDPSLVRIWFNMQLLKLAGHMPDLKTDSSGNKLLAQKSYDFDFEQMRFHQPESREGSFETNQIKFLRLCLVAEKPSILCRVENASGLLDSTAGLVQSMLTAYVRI